MSEPNQMSSASGEFVIKSSGNSFLLRPGMQKGRVWIEAESGEGGDFDQDELYMHIREFYDKRF